jgi:hypothetical protein
VSGVRRRGGVPVALAERDVEGSRSPAAVVLATVAFAPVASSSPSCSPSSSWLSRSLWTR